MTIKGAGMVFESDGDLVWVFSRIQSNLAIVVVVEVQRTSDSSATNRGSSKRPKASLSFLSDASRSSGSKAPSSCASPASIRFKVAGHGRSLGFLEDCHPNFKDLGTLATALPSQRPSGPSPS